MKERAHFERRPWYLFETQKAKEARRLRNAENVRCFERWKARLIRRHFYFFGFGIALLAMLVFEFDSWLIAVPWLLLGFLAYFIFRLLNPPPPPIKRTDEELQQHYANGAGAGGFLTGASIGAKIGAGIGIVGGPVGAIAGTVPGAVIGALVGLFTGRKAGPHVAARVRGASDSKHIARRKAKPARVLKIAGLLTGAGAGVTIGSTFGIAAGPMGAVSGSVAGAFIGGVIGFFCGETAGAHVPD